jgi:hypothetical protein
MTRVRDQFAYNHCIFTHALRAVVEVVISGIIGSETDARIA